MRPARASRPIRPSPGTSGPQVVVEDGRVVAHHEARAAGARLDRTLGPASLEPNRSMHHRAGQLLGEVGLDGRGQHGPAGADDEQGRRVVGARRRGGQGLGQRPGHGVADQGHRHHPLLADEAQQPVGVEAVARCRGRPFRPS